MKVERTIIIEGPAEWVNMILDKSLVSVNKPFIAGSGKNIRETFRMYVKDNCEIEMEKEVVSTAAKDKINLASSKRENNFVK